ncbi:MAG: YraN family protein [bacterium]|nr:YraN family protein [bacterium]
MNQKKLVGKTGENIAVKYLKKNGYKIVKRNFLIRQGEIDIIAFKQEVYYFFEVKARNSTYHGKPVEAVSLQKVKRIKRSAIVFLSFNKITKYRALSVGVISILMDKQSGRALLRCINNIDL